MTAYGPEILILMMMVYNGGQKMLFEKEWVNAPLVVYFYEQMRKHSPNLPGKSSPSAWFKI